MMSTHPYTRKIFSDSLRQLQIKEGDVLFSHSNIAFLGYPQEGNSPATACSVILQAIFDVIGPTGTLIVPTFTYSFPKGVSFDPDKTPSDCGMFTEYIRKLPGAYRSDDPCVSVAAIGERARELTENSPINSYGADCFFERFHKADGKICNINFDAGSTFVHYVERQLQVPYRFDKTFKGVFNKNGQSSVRNSTIWVRFTSSDETITIFEPFDELASSEGRYNRLKVGRGFIGVISAHDTFELIQKTLIERPWLLTRADKTKTIPTLTPES